MSPAEEPPVRVQGTLERVIYQNPDNGYTVLQLQPAGGGACVTVTGVLWGLAEGQDLDVTGRWERHPRYGRRLAAEEVQVTVPTSRVGLERYLGSAQVEGIGPELARRIVATFGEDTMRVLEEEPRRLLQVPGIGRERLRRLQEAWQAHLGRHRAQVFLRGHGLGPRQARRILEEWGTTCVNRIQENPYALTELQGIGFRRADTIAAALGLEGQDPRRLEAGVIHGLEQMVEEGHTSCPRGELLELARDLLGSTPGALEAVVTSLLERDRLREAGGHLYLTGLFQIEGEVAGELARRCGEAPHPAPRLGTASLAATAELALVEGQERALEICLRHRLAVITGGPGVGKTTVIRALVAAARRVRWTVRLAAPTGRAAKRLAEATGHEASTIHRLLGWDARRGGFRHHREHPLPRADLIVVDETSMLDLPLARHLLAALPPAARLVLVGDADQLPSVGPGEVLRDVIQSNAVPVARLTRIFRQREGGLIVENAHRINQGEMPRIPPFRGRRLTDFYFLEEPDPERARDLVVDLVCNRLPGRLEVDPLEEIQVLAPMYRGPCGADSLNRLLGDRLNPGGVVVEGEERGEGRLPLRLGDRVMQVANDYDLEVFNGDLGRITGLAPDTRSLLVRVDDRTITYGPEARRNLVPAYAISIHKSQGAEYPVVVVPLVMGHYVMLRRRLLYTAVTRARRLLVLVGTRQALGKAVRTGEGEGPGVRGGRYTRLAERLREALDGGG